MLENIIDLSNQNEGFIALISLMITILLLLGGWATGLFSWLMQKIKPKPDMLTADLTGASYPKKITFEFKNLSEKKVFIYDLKLKANTGDKFQIKQALPVVLGAEKKQLQFTSDLKGVNKSHRQLQLDVSFGFINRKKYSQSVIWSINNGSIDVSKKHII
jgi:hypothetical protein